MLQCPFCLKPFKNYHSLQRHANRLSKTAADEGQHQWKLPRVEDITILPDRGHEIADEPESKKQKHKGTVSLYQQQLATALVLCLVSVGQSGDPRQAALSVLHQLLRIQHDSLALDTDGQGSQCMGCGIAVYICAWKGKADPRLRRNMWCMMCKDAESTELVRIVSKDSIVKAIKLLTDTTILHMPRSRSEVGQWLGMTSPSIAELDCHLPAMSCKAVLTGFTSDLCTWAESEGAGLSVEERQPDKIVVAVQRMLSSSYLAFTVRMDTASTGEAKQLISMRLQTAHSEWWGEHTAGFIDMHRTTLCLIGMAGTKTAPHADWADAKNFAIAIGRKVKQGAALARWIFVNPCCISRANEFAEREFKQCPKGFDKCTKDGRDTFDTFLSQSDVATLSKSLGTDPNTGNAYVQTVYQHHGQLVHVPAGWLHQVENLQDCVKIAWDMMTPERMGAYMATWQHVLASVIKSNAPDYMAATGVLWVAVQKL
ncbi:hypothetical protein ABBQ38_006663 [Trebouxia sp. C0009 RCD-2024]